MHAACRRRPVVLIGEDGALLRHRQVKEAPELRERVCYEVLADAVVGDCMAGQGFIRRVLLDFRQETSRCTAHHRRSLCPGRLRALQPHTRPPAVIGRWWGPGNSQIPNFRPEATQYCHLVTSNTCTASFSLPQLGKTVTSAPITVP